jgi:hypothetical protein
MRWLLVVGACGCTQLDRRPLADLHPTTAYVYASDFNERVHLGPNFLAELRTPDCASLADDAVATIAGVPFKFLDANHGDHCVGPSVAQTALPDGTFGAEPVTLTISDHSETWTIALPGLYDGNITLTGALAAGATATVGWTGGPEIHSACFSLDDPNSFIACTPHSGIAAQANTVAVTIPPGTASGPAHATVELDGSSEASTPCDGPASCQLELVVSAKLSVAIQ